jgi:hypothetical protein
MFLKNLTQIIVLVVVCTCAASRASAQLKIQGKGTPPCPLKKEQFPKVRGLYLGMPSAEVLQLYPFLKKGESDEAGEAFIFYEKSTSYGEMQPPIKEFKGILNFSLSFLDGQLYHYWIYYDDYGVGSMEEHIKNISQALKLPYRWDRKNSRMRCRDFSIYAVVYGSAALVVEDDVAARDLRMRRARIKTEKIRNEVEHKRQEEQRRRVFRP